MERATQSPLAPSTPDKYRSTANICQITTNDQGALPFAGCKYEEQDEQRDRVVTEERQVFQPDTPQPSRQRQICLKRKRAAIQTVQHVEQSSSFEYEKRNSSKKTSGKKIRMDKLHKSSPASADSTYKDILYRGMLLENHISYGYYTRSIRTSALDIFSELEAFQKERNARRTESKRGEPKRELNAREEWRRILEEGGSSTDLSNLVSVFIKNVGGVQGERCYSQWKGSVLDSVIGAFLAQNASDQLSSSAFMSLAARFPPPKPRYELRCRRGQKNFCGAMDSVHWEGVRRAAEKDVSDAIVIRGNSPRLANRIQAFLNGLVNEGKGLNLEDLRDVAPESTISSNTEFLQGSVGIGPKSVECVRLLALEQKAFPVDTHVARVTIRLGWTPIPQVLDELQTLGSKKFSKAAERVKLWIHQYLWSQLCDLDHKTLYELHCQMITFGKVFCTKNNPNCSGCPMIDNCNYYKSKAESDQVIRTEKCKATEPCTPECLGDDIEDMGYYTRSKKAKASSPVKTPKKLNKGINQTKEHVVYQLPDNHPYLENMNTREVEDSNPYLLFIWEQGEITNQGENSGSSRESLSGTIMIPSRTALRGSFPLNGTFFQFNEVFVDHKTSGSPIKVPRIYLKKLPKRLLYCGTSIAEIAKGLQGEDVSRISRCFNEGYICTREYDQEMRLSFNLHKRFKAKRQASKSNRREVEAKDG